LDQAQGRSRRGLMKMAVSQSKVGELQDETARILSRIGDQDSSIASQRDEIVKLRNRLESELGNCTQLQSEREEQSKILATSKQEAETLMNQLDQLLERRGKAPRLKDAVTTIAFALRTREPWRTRSCQRSGYAH